MLDSEILLTLRPRPPPVSMNGPLLDSTPNARLRTMSAPTAISPLSLIAPPKRLVSRSKSAVPLSGFWILTSNRRSGFPSPSVSDVLSNVTFPGVESRASSLAARSAGLAINLPISSRLKPFLPSSMSRCRPGWSIVADPLIGSWATCPSPLWGLDTAEICSALTPVSARGNERPTSASSRSAPAPGAG